MLNKLYFFEYNTMVDRMKEIIKLENLKKNFYSDQGEVEVLKNISFSINDNEIVSILGPSGCGKSTILNLLSNLEIPTSGKITINGKLGYMFQKDNLMDWRNIYNNIVLPLEINHNKNQENITYAKELMKKYKLKEFMNYYPREISGGMRQRVALIRTLVLKPDLLLLDEPFSALDFQTKLIVQDDIFNIIKSERKSALMVTHDISEAIALSNRIIILSNRPCNIKKIIKLDFDSELTPTSRRTTSLFNNYFKEVYEELNKS